MKKKDPTEATLKKVLADSMKIDVNTHFSNISSVQAAALKKSMDEAPQVNVERHPFLHSYRVGREKQKLGEDLKAANRRAAEDRARAIQKAFDHACGLGERHWAVLLRATRGKLSTEGLVVSLRTIGRHVICPPDVVHDRRKKKNR